MKTIRKQDKLAESTELILHHEADTPLYQQLADGIKTHIASGAWTPGVQLPTYRQMAKITGVSLITVQQAIDLLVNENILYRRQGQGTFVATQDTRVGSNRLGVFLPNLREPFFSVLAQILQTEAINDGFMVSIFSFDDGIKAIAKAIEIMHAQNVDGIITTPAPNPETLDLVLSMRARGIPLVYMDGHPEDDHLCSVECDNRQGMAMILDHLIELGHRRIGFASGPCYTYGLKARMTAFQEIMVERGLDFNPFYVQISHLDRDEGGWDAAQKLLMLRTPPTAIACSTDIIAAGVLQAAKSLNIKVPHELSIAGFDDLYLAAHLEVPLTTVRQPVEKIGRVVMRKLLEAIQRPVEARPESLVLPPKLIFRSSTASVCENE